MASRSSSDELLMSSTSSTCNSSRSSSRICSIWCLSIANNLSSSISYSVLIFGFWVFGNVLFLLYTSLFATSVILFFFNYYKNLQYLNLPRQWYWCSHILSFFLYLSSNTNFQIKKTYGISKLFTYCNLIYHLRYVFGYYICVENSNCG